MTKLPNDADPMFGEPNNTKGEHKGRYVLTMFARGCLGCTLDSAGVAVLNANAERLPSLARRHRISAMALKNVGAVICDTDVRSLLAAGEKLRRIEALQCSRSTTELSEQLTAANIRHLVIKGAPLAVQLYGDPAGRSSKDIDIVVSPGQWKEAASILNVLGYRAREGFDPLHPFSPKDTPFFAATGVHVELHRSLFDHPGFFPPTFDELWGRRRFVELGRHPIPVLSAADNFIYLAAHGTLTNWFRLKWLQDVARIGYSAPIGELYDILEKSRAIGLDRVVSASLVLAADYFGLPEVCRTLPLNQDRATRWIVRRARHHIESEREHSHVGTLREMIGNAVATARLRRDMKHRLFALRVIFVSSADLQMVRLPAWAAWLYIPLRPFLLFRRRFTR